jgi:hypothetical protein
MQPYISITVPTNCYATKLLCVSSRENVSSAGVTLLTAVVTLDQPVDTSDVPSTGGIFSAYVLLGDAHGAEGIIPEGACPRW